MRRRWLLALSLLLLPGCGQAERPRFVPATADAPAASSTGRGPRDASSREIATPKNIPMH